MLPEADNYNWSPSRVMWNESLPWQKKRDIAGNNSLVQANENVDGIFSPCVDVAVDEELFDDLVAESDWFALNLKH